jgi:hypothetical protein
MAYTVASCAFRQWHSNSTRVSDFGTTIRAIATDALCHIELNDECTWFITACGYNRWQPVHLAAYVRSIAGDAVLRLSECLRDVISRTRSNGLSLHYYNSGVRYQILRSHLRVS